MSLLPLRRRAQARTQPQIDLMTMLPVPVLVLDPGDRIVVANAAAETFFNTGQAMLRERGWTGLLDNGAQAGGLGDSLGELVAAARRLDGGYSAYDTELAFSSGRSVRADVLMTPVPDAPGWLIITLQTRAVATLVDRQLVPQGAARSAIGIAAMLAHEIKNPLSGIRGAAQLLAQDASDGNRELTDLICTEVDRVRTLIDRMEGFTDTRSLSRGPENIHAVLNHVVRLGQQGFARGLNIRERYDPSLPPVIGNRDALVQVFLNLFKNAAEAVDPASGEITITTAYRHGLRIAAAGQAQRTPLPLEVSVIDNGPGAPAGIADHMFDAFVSSRPSGTGLGLALVAKLVGDHGGLVEYDRQGMPPRTVFRVLLPTADPRS